VASFSLVPRHIAARTGCKPRAVPSVVISFWPADQNLNTKIYRNIILFVPKQGAEEAIWSWEGESNRRQEKLA
jgi:hypothetical protein